MYANGSFTSIYVSSDSIITNTYKPHKVLRTRSSATKWQWRSFSGDDGHHSLAQRKHSCKLDTALCVQVVLLCSTSRHTGDRTCAHTAELVGPCTRLCRLHIPLCHIGSVCVAICSYKQVETAKLVGLLAVFELLKKELWSVATWQGSSE